MVLGDGIILDCQYCLRIDTEPGNLNRQRMGTNEKNFGIDIFAINIKKSLFFSFVSVLFDILIIQCKQKYATTNKQKITRLDVNMEVQRQSNVNDTWHPDATSHPKIFALLTGCSEMEFNEREYDEISECECVGTFESSTVLCKCAAFTQCDSAVRNIFSIYMQFYVNILLWIVYIIKWWISFAREQTNDAVRDAIRGIELKPHFAVACATVSHARLRFIQHRTHTHTVCTKRIALYYPCDAVLHKFSFRMEGAEWDWEHILPYTKIGHELYKSKRLPFRPER